MVRRPDVTSTIYLSVEISPPLVKQATEFFNAEPLPRENFNYTDPDAFLNSLEHTVISSVMGIFLMLEQPFPAQFHIHSECQGLSAF